jgi:hypothetical protein
MMCACSELEAARRRRQPAKIYGERETASQSARGQPMTWGVDAGPRPPSARRSLSARSGSAVVVISQDLDEIFELADRIAVISRGQLSEAHPAHEMTAEKIGLMMAGSHEKETPHAAHS